MSNYYCARKAQPLLRYWELRDGRILVQEEDGELCIYSDTAFDYTFIRTTGRPLESESSTRDIGGAPLAPELIDTGIGIFPASQAVKVVDPSKL